MLASLLFVGSLALHGCGGTPEYYCGSLKRPLDPAGTVRGTISIGFTWLPHAERHAKSSGVIVAAEGGPGYPSGGSRDSYRRLFGPLLETHDLLMMDDRGTGRSGAIDCKPLQGAAVMTLAGVTRCGQELGPRADLYGTGLAADDLDAILSALHLPKVDLYGDSYGTLFVQVFAARHPARARSITLDGAYPAIGANPWYPNAAPTFQHAFDLVCRRSPQCASMSGTTMERIAQLLVSLRKRGAPISPTQLAFIMDSAGLNPVAYRDLDAAARAYLRDGDTVPLRRLAREAAEYEEEEPADPPAESAGLFAASSCSDNPQVYDMRLQPPAREQQWRRILAQKKQTDPTLYAPFTIDEFLAIPLDYSYVPLCRSWPVASPAHPAGEPIPPGVGMPNIPALVLTGDLDTITTPAEGDQAAALFHNVRRIIVANTGHVTAMGDIYDCASVIVRQFIAQRPIDASCAKFIPAMRLVPAFARRVAEVAPVLSVGPPARPGDRRAAADAVYAASDVVARIESYGMDSGTGLRGGTFTATTHRSITHVVLHGVKWTDDLPVSGTITDDSANGQVSAALHWRGGELHAAWHAYEPDAQASISGTVAGHAILATMPVP